jgi:hypothetical protein
LETLTRQNNFKLRKIMETLTKKIWSCLVRLRWQVCSSKGNRARGEILRHPENSVPKTIVFHNKEIGDKLCRKHRKKFMFLSNYSLDKNNTIDSLFRTQYTPYFLIAEYYGLQNTSFWVTEDLASGAYHRPQSGTPFRKTIEKVQNFGNHD